VESAGGVWMCKVDSASPRKKIIIEEMIVES